VCLFLYGFLFF